MRVRNQNPCRGWNGCLARVIGFAEFLVEPTARGYLSILGDRVSQKGYDPFEEFHRLEDLTASNRYEEAAAEVEELLEWYVLSPRLHILAAKTAHGLEDDSRAAAERQIAGLCLRGMLITGFGTAEEAYFCSLLSDEYDLVARHLKRRVLDRRVIGWGARCYDVLHCSDGDEIWFDITILRAKVGEHRSTMAMQYGSRFDVTLR